jgi:hypothetical protein
MNSSVRFHGMALIFRKVERRKWRIPLVVHLLFPLVATVGGSFALAEQQALLIKGESRNGQIIGNSAATITFDTATAGATDSRTRIPLTAIRQINFGARPRLVSGFLPPRRIDFHGDEGLHVGIESVEMDAAEVSIFGAELRSIPRAALARLRQPAGERSLVYEDFEIRPTLLDGARLSSTQHRSGRQSLMRRPGDADSSFAIDRDVPTGRIELSFYDTGVIEPVQQWFVETELRTGDQSSTVRFCPGWNVPEYRCAASGAGGLAAQPVTRSKGWHRFTLLFDPRRVVALVDDRVVGAGAGLGAPALIRFRNAAVASSGKEQAGDAKDANEGMTATGWIDDLHIFEHAPSLAPPSNTQPNDLLWLATGDELFGELPTIDAREVILAGKAGRRKFPWSMLNGIVFAASDVPAGRPVDGWIATIELASILGAEAGPNDRLVAALQQVTDSELVAAHPYLGTIRIPLREIERIVPQYSGSLRLIDPAHHHLGNEIREDFVAKLAEGSRLQRSFALDALPKQGIFVSLMATDLEPASSPEERFRQQLAAGPLRTELFVNGRRVTDLNQLISWRSKPENPQRLRIALPLGLLKKGNNVLRIEQRPARDDRQEFDDCEISRLAIEIDSVTR